MHENPNYLTTAELAERWRIATGTLRNWRHKGIGPKSCRPSSKRLYELGDVIAWEEMQGNSPTNQTKH